MSEDGSHKAKLLPLSYDGDGKMRAAVFEGNTVRIGHLRKVRDGEPLMGGELFELSPSEAPPMLNADITQISVPAETPANEEQSSEGASPRHKGPARVATRAYKNGWDRIWGNKEPAEA